MKYLQLDIRYFYTMFLYTVLMITVFHDFFRKQRHKQPGIVIFPHLKSECEFACTQKRKVAAYVYVRLRGDVQN